MTRLNTLTVKLPFYANIQLGNISGFGAWTCRMNKLPNNNLYIRFLDLY